MKMKFCQSCGMPLTPEILGTNADGSKNEEYCIYCYKDGAFTGDFNMDAPAFAARIPNIPTSNNTSAMLIIEERYECTSLFAMILFSLLPI